MGDVLLVLLHFGENSTSPGYTTDVDRTSPGPNYWNLGPPNGKVSIEDVLAAVRIYSHNCA
jgi:hypothetical protein